MNHSRSHSSSLDDNLTTSSSHHSSTQSHSPGYKPFHLQQLCPPIAGIKSIESLAVWGNTIYVGTSDGILIIYDVIYERPKRVFHSGASESQKLFSLELQQRKSFSKKAITQLCAVSELSMLISLSDGIIRLHTLNYLNEMDKGLRNDKGVMKNCTMFALKKHQNEWRLVVTFKKKKISLLKWHPKENTFKWVQDLTMPDVVKKLAWADENVLVGFKREYFLVHSSQNKPPHVVFNANGGGSSQYECDCKVLPNEMLICQTGLYVVISHEGAAGRHRPITWGEQPAALAYLNPYLVGALSNYLEVVLLTKNRVTPRLQIIPLEGVTCISQPNYVDLDEKQIDEGQGVGYPLSKVDPDDPVIPEFRTFLAAKNALYILCMNQFFIQARELQDKGRFKYALQLCDIVEGTKYEVETWRVNTIHMEYGYHLFAKAEYEKAMMEFNETDSDPRMVLALFGDIFPCNSRTDSQVVGLPEKTRQGLRHLENPKNKRDALNALIQYLSCRRIPAQKASHGDDEVIGEAIDTSLLYALLLNEDEYMSPLLENDNRCNIADSENILDKCRKYKELVLFYKTKQLHAKSLALLKAHGEKTHPDRDYHELDGVAPTIQYLRDLQDADLIQRFSRWVLKKEPLKALEIFTREYSPFEIDDILELFESIEDGQVMSMKIGYLEYKIHEKDSMDADLHNTLILLYLNYLQSDNVENECFDKEDISDRLIEMLKESDYYHPEKMLSKFPPNDLFLERAILLGKIDRHDQALMYYIHKLDRTDLAEEYCVERYDENNMSTRDIFITAIQLYLQPPEGKEPRIEDVIRLLVQHYDKIDIIKALQLIPDDIYLKNLEFYLQEVLREHVQKRRRKLVMKNLARSENMQVQEQYILERQRHVKIRVNKTCPVCKKAIGSSAFALDP
eukprot:CAMPEP_0117442948 /NCGR_PEP_ID=MMETSP0759-20121206/4428_1 /TAXON_ID=63605 /ORGANISM="Percolomonas cosmopolitus, Strain WS" /LENGTH=905 /DNA_ID=CAMNT_0005234879 /DNA_START=187 /DNA_END=2901 /DNA_ORIENTATION=+